jgi:hypothetical protein
VVKQRAVVKKSSAQSLRHHFLAWQCRIRQIAMRQDGGRPSPGMRPRVLDARGLKLAAGLTVLLLPVEPEEATSYFRFQVMRTADPRDLYERALSYLQAEYFQSPASFSDRLLAVLPQGSAVAAALIAGGRCMLEFEQFSQAYRLPCAIAELKPGDAAREAAIWHNRLFNPALPETVHVLAFEPDWVSARADPGPDGRKTVSF